MKVIFDTESHKVKKNNNLSFGGYKFTKSEDGFKEVEFSYPFDPDKDNCFLEIYKLDIDPYGNYFTTGRAYTRDRKDKIQLTPGSNKIDLSKAFGIDDNQPFAYHYLLEDKHGHGFPRVRIDAGDMIDERSEQNQKRNMFNIVTPNKSGLTRGGAMKLVIIDSQHVGHIYNDQNKLDFDPKLAKRGEQGIKTITNKFGGTLAGLEYGLDHGEYDGYSRIISLPVFTDDDFTAHAYWNKNCMQMASSLGNINNYASFQRKMFAHGLNFVSDGAFVNEGLEGIHFKHMLRWGEKSPYYNWFRASSLKDGPLSLGIFSKNKEYISHKIVNSPYKYVKRPSGAIAIKSNPIYDKTKPTYIQFFDTRLVTEEERKDTTSLIKTYSKMSTSNVYDLHSHNDSVFPYAFEINPEIYNKNIKNLNEYNSYNPDMVIDISSPRAARILSKFDTFVVDGKFESGFETWDANPDIAKLNFVYSNSDALSLKNLPEHERKLERARILRGNAQVQDYVVTSGKYWTQKTDDILRLHIAQHLRYVDPSNPTLAYTNIIKLANNKIFPKSIKAEISQNEVNNVLENLYNHKRQLSDENKKSQIIEGLMNMPLDSCEFGDNLVSVLASPLISKRASNKAEIGLSRYETFKNGNLNLPKEYAKTYNQMDRIYTTEMYDFASEVLNKIDKKLPDDRKLFDGDNVTEYGKYVLPIITAEIAKYAIIKSIAPKTTVAIDKNSGELSYDYKHLKKVSLQSIGITNPASPQDEAEMLLDIMRNGIKNLDRSTGSEIVESITRTLKDTNLYSFQLADLIIDKTQSGLDWRIDATKDIADVEALRNKNTSFEYTWQAVIDFWKKFTDGVISKNPNSYIVAEVTNKEELYEKGHGYKSDKFKNVENDVVQKFLRETGITSIAEYSLFFRDTSKMFGADYEDGGKFEDPKYMERIIFEKMMKFIRTGSLDSLRFAYTFIGNHDKPRALHCAAIDMTLFYHDLNDDHNGLDFEYRRKAYQLINDKFHDNIEDWQVHQYDFSGVSPKAIAMGDAIRPALINVLEKYRSKYSSNEEFNQKAYKPISKAVSDLAQGKFQGKRFDADAFGIKPIDVAISMVIKQAKTEHGLELPPSESDKYEDEVFEAVMKPAFSKLLGMMKILVALPGMPTLFDGDDAGSTGYDSKTKNMYVQGRQRNHDEWLNSISTKYKKFIDEYNKYLNDAMAVRKNPKCNALNNGAIYTLPLNKSQTGELVPSILRQSSDGRMTISIFNPTGMHNDFRKPYMQNNIYIDKIYFNEAGDSTIGVPGLKVGTRFYNVNSKDPNESFKVGKDDKGSYYLTRIYNEHPENTNEDKEVPIPLHDTTMILYHVPEGGVPLSFTGSCMVKPKLNDITNAYTVKNVECGKQLAVVK